MALEAQGILIRRQSTTAGSTATFTSTSLIFDSTLQRITDVAGNFISDGYVNGMRLENNSSANSTRVLTVSSVPSSFVMSVSEPVVTQAAGASITLTGHSLEPIAEVMTFTGPSGSASIIDVTSLQSTAKEKLIGLRDEGQVSMDVFFNTDTTALQTAMRADRASRTKRVYDIQYTDSTSTPSYDFFDAYVTGFSISGGVDDATKGSITLEITSAVKSVQKA